MECRGELLHGDGDARLRCARRFSSCTASYGIMSTMSSSETASSAWRIVRRRMANQFIDQDNAQGRITGSWLGLTATPSTHTSRHTLPDYIVL